ncbi:MAG: histidine--tRNA ligase [Ruminococcaceae bacterium]|nr:histidine--tRNA ligase [Oscillospiraceae bacterium]
MALITKAVKGTLDFLPQNIYKNQFVENSLLQIGECFGFKEIRTPVFEHTELFTRSVGDTTDVVQKEMYTFNDKGDRSITLRPEGTAGAARAFLENGLFNEPLPLKVCYLTSCYRYEKPQAGRLREFHQFGVECFGTSDPAADAEVISLASQIFDFFEVDNIALQINSIGCPKCRAEYHKALKEYFESKKADLCHTCLERLDKNPMRILDCKSPICSDIAKDAPKILDYLCEECDEHFKKVQKYLDVQGIEYTINPSIVRGLDYYTKTVFEFVSSDIGAQGTVCGGGRYDGLIEEIGGPSIPSLGFGMGLERLMLLLEAQKRRFPEERKPELFIVTIGDEAKLKAVELARELRLDGSSVLYDLGGRSMKAQMKLANKLGAQTVIVLGEDEIKNDEATIKDMASGATESIRLSELPDRFMSFLMQQAAVQAADTLNFFNTEG